MVTKTIAMLADLYGDLKRNFKSLSPTCTWGTIINQKAKNYGVQQRWQQDCP